MKKTLSILLAALLTASVMTGCVSTLPEEKLPVKDDFAAVETSAPVTDAPVTDVSETDAPLLTENGEARAAIVLSETASDLLRYAAEELRYHIEKVSGASPDIITGSAEGLLPIVIATPDSDPTLTERFRDDLDWLTTLEENGTSYGDDGFAVRWSNGALYIFGATDRGALNGVYDFIEENLGVLWIRAEENGGLIYEEMPTVTLSKTDYREKSPFAVRGWVSGGRYGGAEMMPTDILYSRSKLNASSTCIGMEADWVWTREIGNIPVMVNHYMKHWILTSPLYDPACTEYWNKREDGTVIPIEEFSQINFWSDLTLDCLTESVLAYLRETGADNVAIGMEDNDTCPQYPECTLPFEYAPGEFVKPGDHDYLTTVYYTFLNKVADRVAAEFPEVTINTFAYWILEAPPRCEVRDNIRIIFAPILEDVADPLMDTSNPNNAPLAKNLEGWVEKSDDIVLYTYYGCSYASKRYERPIWSKMQADLRWFADHGIAGVMPEGTLDRAGGSSTWTMNTLTFWLYSKLCWNPDEDIDALITEFCDKVYGEASEPMQEYYRLIRQGWEEGESENYHWNFKLTEEYYFDTFVYYLDLEDDIIDALNRAYEAADEVGKARILPIIESYEAYFIE